jgi:hypothetical protein
MFRYSYSGRRSREHSHCCLSKGPLASKVGPASSFDELQVNAGLWEKSVVIMTSDHWWRYAADAQTSGNHSEKRAAQVRLQVIDSANARSFGEGQDLVTDLQTQGIHFQSVTDQIDTSTPAGRFFFHVMASLAQMERELIVERTRAGLEAARRLGRVGGRKRRMTESKVEAARQLLANGTPPKDVAKNLGVSVPTLYRWLPAATRV